MNNGILISTVGLTALLLSCSNSGQPQSPGKGKLTEGLASTNIYRANLTAHRIITKPTPESISYIDEVLVSLINTDSTHKVSGGSVLFNGNNVSMMYGGDGGANYQSIQNRPSGSDTVSLAFNGGYQVFRIAGGPGFPPFTDSLQAPNSIVDIFTPHVGDTLSKSAGFTIAWSGGQPVSQITIIPKNGGQGFGRTLHGESSVAVLPTDISGMNPGAITIIVSGGNYRGSNSIGIDRMISIYSSISINATMIP